MPIRKRRQPAPWFRRPAPYSGATGQHAGIGPAKPDLTRLAMFQVCVTDTHDNYVGCCGLDPEANVYFDSAHPMAVAKPYDVRGTFPYTVGQVIVCAKVRTKLGDNPGVASSSTGQPADLDEEIDMLKTDAGLPIFWLHVGGGGPRVFHGTLSADLAGGSTATVTSITAMDGGNTPDEPLTVGNSIAAAGASGQWCLFMEDNNSDDSNDYEMIAVANTSQTVVTNEQIVGASKLFQIKTRKAWANFEGAESDWTTIHTGGACP